MYGAVIDSLKRQTCLKIALASGNNAHAGDDVVDYFAAATPEPGINAREVMLHVDPLANNERCGHELLQDLPLQVLCGVVRMEKDPSLKVELFGQTPPSKEKAGIAGETPLGTGIRPVHGASGNVLVCTFARDRLWG